MVTANITAEQAFALIQGRGEDWTAFARDFGYRPEYRESVVLAWLKEAVR